MRTSLAVGLSLAVALPSSPLAAQEPHLQLMRARLQQELEQLADGFEGVAGIQVLDLASGDRLGVNADLVFPQGSAIKVQILLELFRRAEAEPGLLAKRVVVRKAEQVGGTGVLRFLADGRSELALEDLAILMVVESDNTATNLLIDALGMDAVNRLSAGLGAPHTLLQRKMIRPEASASGQENLSTPAEAAALMQRIHGCDLPLSADSCGRVREILELPKDDAVRRPIPASVPVAFKPGSVEGVATAWALVSLPDRPYVLTVMTNYGGDGAALVEAVSDAAWRYFSRLARTTDHGVRVPLDVIRRRRGGP